MRHLKGFLWLALWSVWLWLGFGLYRELPRNLGQLIRHFPAERLNVEIMGFVENKPLVITWNRNDYLLANYDALSGERRRIYGILRHPRWTLRHEHWTFEFSPSRRLIRMWGPLDGGDIATVKASDGKQPKKHDVSLEHVLDLDTGRVTYYSGLSLPPINHLTKPWTAYWSGATLKPGDNFVVVVDLEHRTRVFEWKETPTRLRVGGVSGQPFFIGDKRIGVPIFADSRGAERSETVDVEVWTIPPGRSPEKLLKATTLGAKMIPIGGGYTTLRDGKVAWHRYLESGIGVAVFDVDTDREAFFEIADDADQRHLLDFHGQPPQISSDGKRVFNVFVGRLWDIDRHQLLWKPSESEHLQHISADRFEVKEIWKFELGKWSREISTYSVRHLSTGALECRTWRPSLQNRCVTDDGRRLALDDSDVFELTLPLDWSLFAVCQTILAAPLILLWLVLRWRQLRATRSQPAVANLNQ